ncbi:MAG: hypothetical protein WCY19_07510 [Candidatus Gastranaerophilaceae bacterium]
MQVHTITLSNSQMNKSAAPKTFMQSKNYSDGLSFGINNKIALKREYAKTAKKFFDDLIAHFILPKKDNNINELATMPEGALKLVLLDKEKDILLLSRHNDETAASFCKTDEFIDFVSRIKNKKLRDDFFAREHNIIWERINPTANSGQLVIKNYLGKVEELLKPKTKGEFIKNNYSLLNNLLKNSKDYLVKLNIEKFLDIINQAGEHKEAFYKKFGYQLFVDSNKYNYGYSRVYNQIKTLNPQTQKAIFSPSKASKAILAAKDKNQSIELFDKFVG